MGPADSLVMHRSAQSSPAGISVQMFLNPLTPTPSKPTRSEAKGRQDNERQ